MLVSPELKKIFIHIPKTGGTSVKQAIRDVDKSWYSLDHVHSGVRELVRSKETVKRNFNGYQIFAIVREPWDITVSLYRFRQETKNLKLSFTQWLMRGNLTERASTFPKQLPYIHFPKQKVTVKYFKYEKGFKQIEKFLGIKIKHNIHNYGKYNSKDYFTQQSFDYLNELCKEDIKFFNWKIPDWSFLG